MRRTIIVRAALAGTLLVSLIAIVAILYALAGNRRDTTAAPGTTAPAPGAADGPLAVDPRAEVTLDLRRQQLIGVRTATVTREPFDKTIRTVGIVKYDETRIVDVNLKIEGWIRNLFVESPGQYVRRGQPLFTLYSPELLATQQEYLLALRTREQMQQSQVPDAREYADRLVQAARENILITIIALAALYHCKRSPTRTRFVAELRSNLLILV